MLTQPEGAEQTSRARAPIGSRSALDPPLRVRGFYGFSRGGSSLSWSRSSVVLFTAQLRTCVDEGPAVLKNIAILKLGKGARVLPVSSLSSLFQDSELAA